jgi:hypothetical protein
MHAITSTAPLPAMPATSSRAGKMQQLGSPDRPGRLGGSCPESHRAHGTTTGVGRDVHAGAPVTKGEKKKRGEVKPAPMIRRRQLLGLEPTSCPAQPWRASGHRTHKRVMHSDKLYKAWRWIKQNNECVIRNNDMIDTLSAISVVVRSDGHILQRSAGNLGRAFRVSTSTARK